MLSALYANRRHNEEGFTLIELLVVVIIIGILAAIALPIFIDQQKVAIDASVKSDVRNTVTNITSAQSASNPTTKLAKSRDETSVKVYEGTSTDADVITDNSISTPVLGTKYAVEGKNAKGLKYATQVYRFDSTTGQFSAADATVPAGVVVKSFDFDNGTQGWLSYDSQTTVNTGSIAGHASALHLNKVSWSGSDSGLISPIDFSTTFQNNKTYKLDADLYVASPSTDFTYTVQISDQSGTYKAPSVTTAGSWKHVSTTFVINGENIINPRTYFQKSSSDFSNAQDYYLDNVVVTKMD